MAEGRRAHLARIGLILVALILLGLFACPPRSYARLAQEHGASAHPIFFSRPSMRGG
jgi:hypothetical protein